MKFFEKIKNWFGYYIRRPVVEILYSLNKSLQRSLERGAKALEQWAYGPTINYDSPTKAEREEQNKHISIIIAIIISVVVLSVIVIWFAKYYFTIQSANITFEEWNSSAGSFWGAILGATIAGIVTICTTVLIIQRSYKIDYHRERLEALPVLDLKIFLEHYTITADGEADLLHISKGQTRDAIISFGIYSIGDDAQVFALKNVGAGIAYNIRTSGFFSEDYEEAYCGDILPSGGELVFATSQKQKGEVFLTFLDLYENLYRQSFSISQLNGHTKVTTFPPELVRKTKRIRYTQ